MRGALLASNYQACDVRVKQYADPKKMTGLKRDAMQKDSFKTTFPINHLVSFTRREFVDVSKNRNGIGGLDEGVQPALQFPSQGQQGELCSLKEHAKELSQVFRTEFHLADFGCSHGRNSMECVKAAFDGYAATPSSIRVYLNDLPDNDFGEVFKCLNDPTISYNQNALAKQTRVSTCANGQNFYTQCFPNNHLHLAFTFNCLHWLERPIPLSRALFGSSDRVSSEEAERLASEAHAQLVEFLNVRAKELTGGGRLVATFVKGGTGISYFEDLWKSYVESTGIELIKLKNVVIPTYNRTDEQVQYALAEVQDKFRTLTCFSFRHQHGTFTINNMRSLAYNVMVKGLKSTNLFDSIEECEAYIDGFFQSTSDNPPSHIIDFHVFVLERLAPNQ